MTEYNHATGAVEKVGAGIFNSSTTKIYVDGSSSGWSQANAMVRDELHKGDKFYYKRALRTFLWEEYFQNHSNVHTLGFWERLIDDVSNLDRLDIHTQSKALIRATLKEVMSHYINNGCMLLPLVASRSPNAPAWHALSKPTINGFPYEDLLEAYKWDCRDSEYRTRKASAKFGVLFSSLRIPSFKDYTPELDEALTKTLRNSIGDHDLYEYGRLTQTVANYCCSKVGAEMFTTHFYVSGALSNRKKPTVIKGVYSSEEEALPRHDPVKTMRTYVLKVMSLHNVVHKDIWLDEVTDWIGTLESKSISPQYRDVCLLFEWMSLNRLNDMKSEDFKRKHFLPVSNKVEISVGVFDFLKKSVKAKSAKSRVVRHYVDFFAHCSDRRLDSKGHAVISPLNESDKKRFVDTDAKNRRKSNKPVLPRRIIEMAKEILLQNDYAFARRFQDQRVTITNGDHSEEIFVPTVSNVLYLILSIPIRTSQALMLDSGEADEYIVTLSGELNENMHSLAKRGRRLGYARRFAGANGSGHFSGLFVNTNKESVQEQKGYEIPYHDSNLMKVLAAQRAFQEEFNPTDVMIDRSQLGPNDLRYQGNNTQDLETYTFLFRDIRKGAQRWDAMHRDRVSDLWISLLLEIQSRLEEGGDPVQLVWEDKNGNLKTDFTLHSLRVSNITHFIEAGVPLHVLAEFLSGHQTLVMTLYYTKLGPQKINEVISAASKNLLDAEEDEFFDRLTEMSRDLLNEHVVGKADGIAQLHCGDPGLWHLDIDGICTAGKARCGEGLERRDSETGKKTYEPIYPDGFNCGLCRFHVTGPAFLAGQVTVTNTLLYSIRRRSEQQDKLFEKVIEAKGKKNNRVARIAQDQLDKVSLELEERIASLGARVGNIYRSLDLMHHEDDGSSSKTALITQMEPPEIEAHLSEASSFEGMEWASQAVEFFPQLPDSDARFRKGILLEKMAQENGLRPLLLHLSENEMQTAGNRLTTLMAEFYGQKETSDLISGKVKLEELGGLSKFQVLVGEAIKIGGSDVAKISRQTDMIEVDDEH